jgi:hypothetical protein
LSERKTYSQWSPEKIAENKEKRIVPFPQITADFSFPYDREMPDGFEFLSLEGRVQMTKYIPEYDVMDLTEFRDESMYMCLVFLTHECHFIRSNQPANGYLCSLEDRTRR